MAIFIMIEDDNALVRATIRAVLSAEPDFHVTGEAENGHVALRVV